MHTARLTLLLASAALLAACDASPTGRAAERVPTALDIVSGDEQHGAADTELADPLVVRVTDANGDPVSGQAVNFRVVAGGGDVFAGVAITNSQGLAKERWTLGTVAADSQRVEARAVDVETGERLTFAVFRATAAAGAPESVEIRSANPQNIPAGSTPDSLRVRVLDRHGNPVAGAAASWVVTGGARSASPATSVSNAAGEAATLLVAGTAVSTLTTAEARVGPLTAVFTVNEAIPASAELSIVSGDNQVGSPGDTLANDLVVRLHLPDGRPISGAGVSWVAAGPLHGEALPPTSQTDANGEARTRWRRGTRAGYQEMRAYSGSAPYAYFHSVPPPGPATQMSIVQGNLQWALVGQTLATPLQVRVRDANGTGVPNTAVGWTVTAGGGTVAASSVTNAEGIAQVSWTVGPAAGQHKVVASLSGVTAVTFSATVQTAVGFTLNTPTPDQVVANQMPIQVTAQCTDCVQGVAATVNGRTVHLTQNAGQAVWTGTLSMVGFARGSQTLSVTLTTRQGNTATQARSVIYDRPPQITWITPAAEAKVTRQVRVAVTCADDDPAGCTYLRVYDGYNGPLLLQGTSSVDGVLDFSSRFGEYVRLVVRFSDSRGQARYRERVIYIHLQ